MTEADRIMHDAFSASSVESLASEGATETQLAQRIATDSWHGSDWPNDHALSPRCAGKEGISGQRIIAVEDNLFALGHSSESYKIETEIETEDPEIDAPGTP